MTTLINFLQTIFFLILSVIGAITLLITATLFIIIIILIIKYFYNKRRQIIIYRAQYDEYFVELEQDEVFRSFYFYEEEEAYARVLRYRLYPR